MLLPCLWACAPGSVCDVRFGAWVLVPLQRAVRGFRWTVLLGSVRIRACVLALQGAAAREWPYVSGRVHFGAWVLVLLQGARCPWQCAS